MWYYQPQTIVWVIFFYHEWFIYEMDHLRHEMCLFTWTLNVNVFTVHFLPSVCTMFKTEGSYKVHIWTSNELTAASILDVCVCVCILDGRSEALYLKRTALLSLQKPRSSCSCALCRLGLISWCTILCFIPAVQMLPRSDSQKVKIKLNQIKIHPVPSCSSDIST